MSKVNVAFQALRSNLEITQAEQDLASSRHILIRDHIRSRWSLSDDFLTGSYRRHTKTKKLKDVDIFVVVDPNGAQAEFENGTGDAAIAALAEVLSSRWTVKTDSNVVRVEYAGEDVASYEVAPVFAKSFGYLIPNGSGWMKTDPKVHAALVTGKNKACSDLFVPFVKMLKAINREAGEPIRPSFLLEVMALELVDAPFGSFPDEVRYFLASAADQIHDRWRDPAGLGDDVNAGMSSLDRQSAASILRGWLERAEYAVRLDQKGDERAAVMQWRTLFGSRMPMP